jgi:membrane-associated PAP2 superfamily phosphatase
MTTPAATRVPARDAAIAGVALLGLALWEWSGWDLAAARLYGGVGGFGWRETWLTSGVAHQGGRWLAWVVLALMVADAIRPLIEGGPSRRERWYWIGVVLACTVLVPGLKRLTHSSCPWDLTEFGGVAAYVPHWRWSALDGGPGHCFPSGHAVAAFAFFGICFGWRRSRPGLARAWLIGVCVFGALFGWAQLARGAHYPSHTLWSAWLCWSLCVLADLLPRQSRGDGAKSVSPIHRTLGAD